MIKAGSLVVCNTNHSHQFTKGKIYEVLEVINNSVKLIDDAGSLNGWSLSCFDLYEKPFTQEDLEVGMWVTYMNYNQAISVLKEDLEMWRLSDNILVIYKPDEKGNLIKVWERKEKKYILKCPITNQCLVKWEDDKYKWLSEIERAFIQKEIDELPNQELVKTLIKKEV